MARLLFLGASVSQLPAIRFAKIEGHSVVACDGDPDAVAFPFCDVAAVVDFSNADAVVEVAGRERVDGVLAICTDRAVVPAALVAERLGLPGIAPAVARAMTHKPTMRARLAFAGVPQPTSRTVAATDDLTPLQSVPLPAVLKPADSGGQRGLYRIERLDQLEELLPATLAVSRTGEAIFEQYIDGLEVNTLFAVRGGVPKLLTISDRLRPSGAGFGVGWIHSYPSRLPASTQAEVEEVASRAIRALGMNDGIAFPQLIAAERGVVVVVEVAARIAAGQMADLVRHATGIELYRIAIQQAVGLPVPDAWVTAERTKPVAIRFLTAAPGVLPLGVIRSISGLERVRSARGVLDAGLYFGPGAEIGPLQVDADRRGYVIATAATATAALARADAAARRLQVNVEPGPNLAGGRKRSRSRRGRMLAAPGLVAVLLVATVGAFALTEWEKLQRPLIRGTQVDKTFSPLCRCPQDVAHIAFRLVRRTAVEVTVVSSSGKTVARLVGPRELGARLIRLVWNGHESNRSVAPNGRYFPDVSFPGLDRSLRLPSPIALDNTRPQVERAAVRRLEVGIVVRYRFSEPAQALLLVDGRRAVLTRFAPTAGVVRWSGRFATGHPLANGRHSLELIAIDLAGNHSLPHPLGHYPER